MITRTERAEGIHPRAREVLEQVFFDRQVNIAAQYLQADGAVGYVVMDVESDKLVGLMADLEKIPATIRTRILH